MTSRDSALLGFVSAGLIGSVGAVAINAFARAASPPGDVRFEVERPAPITIKALHGSVFALSPAGLYRPASVGDSMARPAGIRLDGPGSWVRVERGPVEVLLSHDARASFQPSGGAIHAVVSNGRIIVSSAAQPVSASVVDLDLDIRGKSFGLWVQDGQAWIAVLGDEIRVSHRGKEDSYGPGREIVVTASALEADARPAQLEVEAVSISNKGQKTYFNGKTHPKTEVLVRSADGAFTSVKVGPDGSFSAPIAGDRPALGEVVAHDAAGRFAELGLSASTAGSLDDAVRGLTRSGQGTEPPKPVEPKAEVKPAEPKPEPKEEPKAEPVRVEPKPKPGKAAKQPKVEKPKPAKPVEAAKPTPTPDKTPNEGDGEKLELEWE